MASGSASNAGQGDPPRRETNPGASDRPEPGQSQPGARRDEPSRKEPPREEGEPSREQATAPLGTAPLGNGTGREDDDDLDFAWAPEYAGAAPGDLMDEEGIQAARAANLSAEVMEAGFWPRGEESSSGPRSMPRSLSGFGSGDELDVCEPGPVLAGLTDAAAYDGNLANLDDDELIGVIRAWRRLESWTAAGTLSAIAELARRRPAAKSPPAQPGSFPGQMSEFISDEIAAALTLTGTAADKCLDLALDLAMRLPGTARALRAGAIDYLKTRIIAEATKVLGDDDARSVENLVLPDASQQTTGQLRVALARAVLAVDPEAAERRREQAQKDPRVRRWREDAGTAALAGYGLPPAEVLEADQHLTSRALDLRDAGLKGSLDQLRARAYLDALLGRDSSPTGPPLAGEPVVPGEPVVSGEPVVPAEPSPPGESWPTAPAESSRAPAGGRLAARVNLTVPLTTLLGLANEPANVAGFGPADPALARQMGTWAGLHPATRWFLTVTDDNGQAIGHGAMSGRRPAEVFAHASGGTGAHASGGASPGDRAGMGERRLGARELTVKITALARDTCDHRNEEPGYAPSRRLQNLIRARTATCSAPGCARPAGRCDLDHTVPYDRGGRTCECGLAPLCRRHHRCKQAEGWRLLQSSPGQMCWITPSGRRYITAPTAYP